MKNSRPTAKIFFFFSTPKLQSKSSKWSPLYHSAHSTEVCSVGFCVQLWVPKMFHFLVVSGDLEPALQARASFVFLGTIRASGPVRRVKHTVTRDFLRAPRVISPTVQPPGHSSHFTCAVRREPREMTPPCRRCQSSWLQTSQTTSNYDAK